jgi:hypothetical protein
MAHDKPGKERWPEGPGDRLEGRSDANVSKSRGDTEDSRATAHIGEHRDGASTNRTASGEIARIAEHEARIRHEDRVQPAPVDLGYPRNEKPAGAKKKG